MSEPLSLTIAGRKISASEPPYVIAEMSCNHNGSLDHALAIVEAAKKTGADAIKLQTYTADTMTIESDGPGFQIEGGLWDGRTLYDLYQEAHTPWEWHKPLFARGRELGITVFSSPFDATAVEFLEGLDTPAYKVASFELVDIPLIRRIAQTGKPMIMSTGMASIEEIGEAVAAARDAGATQIALMHCVSGYPAPARDANLQMIGHLSYEFDVLVGLSDHTLDIGVSVAAVACGATLIEKHLTLSRDDGGPDSAFSAEPDELAALVHNVALAAEASGKTGFIRGESEASNRVFRRSLYIVEDIASGDMITDKNLRAIRPGHGLPPKFYDEALGKKAKQNISRGTPLSWDLID
jgi:N-acetylneuraminate synthase